MASRRLSSLLALEVESADRPSDERPGDSGVDPPHLSRESAVGRASNSIGTAPTRVKCDGKDRGEISGESRQASLADLEDISCQSCQSDCSRRFFRDDFIVPPCRIRLYPGWQEIEFLNFYLLPFAAAQFSLS